MTNAVRHNRVRTSAVAMLAIALVLVSFLSAPPTHAVSPNNVVTYQGRLLNPNGVPVSDASLNFQFRLYDDVAAGSCLWSNDDSSCASNANMSVTLTDGLFTVDLGDTGAGFAAIPDTVFADNADVFLEVEIEGETLGPRKALTAAPYAVNSQTLDGLDSTDLCQSDGTNCLAGSSLWESGAFATYEDDDDVVVGSSGTETISNPAFTLSGNDLFAADQFGSEGGMFTDTGLFISSTFSMNDSTLAAVGTGYDIEASDLMLMASTGGQVEIDATTALVETGANIDMDASGAAGSVTIDTVDGAIELTSNGTSGGLFLDSEDDMTIVGQSTSSGAIFLNAPNGGIDVDLGGGAGDNFTVDSGSLIVASNTNNTTLGGDLLPSADNLRNLGSSSLGWNAIFVRNTADSATVSLADTAGTSTSGAAAIGTFDEFTNSSSTNVQDVLDDLDAAITASGSPTLDNVYDNDPDKILNVDTADLEFSLDGAGLDFLVDMESTGNFRIQEAGVDSTTFQTDGDVLMAGGNLFVGSDVVSGVHASFSANGDDIFTTGDIAAQDSMYADTFVAGDASTIYGNGTLTTTADYAMTITGGDLTFAQATVIGDGGDALTINSNGTLTVDDTTLVGSGALTVDATAAALTLGSSATSASICNSASCDTVSIGTNADADTISIGDVSDSTSVNSANWSIATSGNVITAGDVAVNGGDVTSTATTLNVAVGNTGTINFTDGTNTLASIADNGTTGNLSVTGRILAAAHAANTGLRVPTNAGVPAAVTGTQEGDIVWDSTNNNAYMYDGAAFQLIGGASGGTATLQTAYNNGNTITTTTGNNITFTFPNVATDTSFVLSNTSDSDLSAVALTATQSDDADATDDLIASDIQLVNNSGDAGDTVTGLRIQNTDTASNQVTDTLISLDNLETSAAVTSGILIGATGTVTNAIDASAANIGNALSAGANDLTATNWSITGATGNVTTSGDLALNGGDLTSTSGTFNFLDAAGNSGTIEIGGVTTDLGNTLRIVTNSTTADTITIGNANAGTTMALTGGTAWNITTTGVFTGSDFTCTDCLDFTEFTDAMVIDAATSITGTAGNTLSISRTLTDAAAENGLTLNVTASDTTSGTILQRGFVIQNQSSTEAVDQILRLHNVDADDAVDVGLQIDSNAGGINTAIDIASANITTDFAMQNDATIDNDTNGDINLTENARALTFDFDAVASRIQERTASELQLFSSSNTASALTLESTAGGIDITASAASAGEDIDLTATGSSINLSSTENVGNAMTFTTSGAASGMDFSTGTGGYAMTVNGNAALGFNILMDGITDGDGMAISADGLTTSEGALIVQSTSSAFTSADMILFDQQATMTGTTVTGSVLDTQQSISNTTAGSAEAINAPAVNFTRVLNVSDGGAGTATVTGSAASSVLNVQMNANETSGQVNYSGDVLKVDQNFADPTSGHVLNVENASQADAIFVNAQDNGRGLNITSSATSANAINVAAASMSTGNLLDLTGNALSTGNAIHVATSGTFSGNLTSFAATGAATGNFLNITSTSATATAVPINIDLDNGNNNNNVFVLTSDETTSSGTGADTIKARITASGEFLSDKGFTAGGASTNYYDGSITSSSTMTIDSSGTVQLGTDDDFLPQLGAGSADIGSSGTRWDNIFGVAADLSGTLTVADITCTDCLDFTEFADAMSLDASTSISTSGSQTLTFSNGSTGNIITDLTSTGDWVVQDAGSTFLTLGDTGSYAFTLDATDNPGYSITNSGSGTISTNLAGTGDFNIQDGGVTYFSFTDDTTVTYNPTVTNNGMNINANSLQTENALEINATALTTGTGLLVSNASASTSADTIRAVHGNTYAATATMSGNVLDASRSLTMNDGGAGTQVLTVNSALATFSSNMTQTSGTVTDSGNVVLISQNYANATGGALNVTNDGTGPGMIITQNGNGRLMTLTDSATTALGIAVTANSMTLGNVIDINANGLTGGSVWNSRSSAAFSGDHIQMIDSGAATGNFLNISSTSATATAKALNIDLDNGNNNNDVIVLTSDETTNSGTAADTVKARLTASGEFLSDVGFTAGGASTKYRDGSIDSSVSTLSINTTNNQPITTGTGLFTTGGAMTTNGTTTVNGVTFLNSAVHVDGGDFESSSSTFDFLDAVGNSTGIDIGGNDVNIGNTIRIATNSTTADTLTVGNANASTLMTLTGGDDWSITSAGLVTTANDIAVNGGDITSTGSLTIDSAGTTTLSDSTVNFNLGVKITSAGGGGSLTTQSAGQDLNLVADDELTFTSGATSLFTFNTGTNHLNIVNGNLKVGNGTPDVTLNGEDAYVEGTLEVDSDARLDGDLAVNGGDITSTATLNITPSGAGNDLNLNPADDLLLNQGDDISAVFAATGQITFDAIATDSTIGNAATGVMHLAVDANPASTGTNQGFYIDYETIDDANANQTFSAVSIDYMNSSEDAGDATRALTIVNTDNSSGTAVPTDTLIRLNNADTTAGSLTTAILIQSTGVNNGITTAIDASGSNIATALDVGGNDIAIAGGTIGSNAGTTIDFGKFDVSSGGVVSIDLNATATINGVCHSGADVDVATDTERDLVPCSAAPDDYAEWYETDGSVSAGDVVALTDQTITFESTQSNPFTGALTGTVAKTLPVLTQATHTSGAKMFGVVSTSPIQVIGSDLKRQGQHPQPIALNGRIPLKASAENGAIAPGDALTASATPGYAMKASAGDLVVATALGALADGTGTIQAFVRFGAGEANNAPAAVSPASQTTSSNLTSLDMNGNIYLNGNDILGIRRLAGIGERWSIEEDGTVKTTGTLQTIIASYQNTNVVTTAVTSPDVTLTLAGTGTLENGQAVIRFEDTSPDFNDVISSVAPIRVVVTPDGPVSLYVSAKDNNGFTVQQLGGTDTGVTFDWMVSAYRKDYEPTEAIPAVNTDAPITTDPAPSDTTGTDASTSTADPTTDPATDATVSTDTTTASTDTTTPTTDTTTTDTATTADPAPPASPDASTTDSTAPSDGGVSAEPPPAV